MIENLIEPLIKNKAPNKNNKVNNLIVTVFTVLKQMHYTPTISIVMKCIQIKIITITSNFSTHNIEKIQNKK